jgi:uncharacterized phage protein (TIGR01671 family)
VKEIKFRGKRIDTGEWIYGFPHIIDTVGGGYYTGRAIQIQFLNSRPISIQIDKETLSEYTGLKDKNNKDIFEGDIVNRIESTGYRFVGEVVYEEYGFGIKPYGFFTPLSMKGKYDDGKSSFDFSVEYEIIGNAYDHPELLEEA